MNQPSIFAQRIAECRQQAAVPVGIEVVAETGSTNSDLLARVPDLQEPVFLVAESQTQGRGRAGRAWLSSPGVTLTFSLAWQFDLPLHRLVGLPLAAGVAVAEALAARDVFTTLKWPNDILRGGKKLGGILIETAQGGGGVWAVIGIGLNLELPDALEAQIGQPAAEARWLAQGDRHALLAGLLDSLVEVMRGFGQAGFVPFRDRWNRLHAHAGKNVAIVEHDRVLFEGIAVGVDETGRLLIDTPAGRQAVVAGDVSLREG